MQIKIVFGRDFILYFTWTELGWCSNRTSSTMTGRSVENSLQGHLEEKTQEIYNKHMFNFHAGFGCSLWMSWASFLSVPHGVPALQPDSKVTMLSNETSRKTSRISGEMRSSEANPKMKMGRSMLK